MRKEDRQGHPDQDRTGPRIYIASLADYADGRLHGAWIDATRPLDDMTVARIAGGISEHGEAFAHWAGIVGTDEEALSGFDDAYWGRFDSLVDFGNQMIEALGWESQIEDAVPEMLRPFVRIDAAGFAQELKLSGIVTMTAAKEGGVHVFEVARS